MTTLNATFADGTAAVITSFDHPRIVLDCGRAFAPGQPLRCSAALDPPLGLHLKSDGTRRQDDGRFELRARVVTITREDRQRLHDALATS